MPKISCVIDPERYYETLENAVAVGGRDGPPALDELPIRAHRLFSRTFCRGRSKCRLGLAGRDVSEIINSNLYQS